MVRAFVVMALMIRMVDSARADCAPDATQPRDVSLEVTFLGQFSDLLGHRASFFIENKTSAVIGPVDHKAGEKLPTKMVPGAPGTLALRVRAEPGGPIGGGWFKSFKVSGAAIALDSLVPRISDPFVLGLLASSSAAAEAEVAKLRTPDGARRDELMLAAHGMLYAASGTRAQQLLAGIGYRDIASAELARVATLRDGGLAAVAKLPPERQKGDWTDYLPELASAYLTKKKVSDVLDDLLIGNGTPSVPIEIENPFRRGCGPSRTQIRGPFAGPDELTPVVLRDLVRRVDKKFAAEIERAFKNASASDAAYVIGMRGKVALLVGRDAFTAVTLPKSAPVGSTVRYVARSAQRDDIFAIPHLEDNESPITAVGKTSRLEIKAVDAKAILTLLKDQMRSGALPVHAGMALASLFELADKLPGWTLADARAYAWSLPGNVYDKPEEWLGVWSDILAHAVRYAEGTALADEVERALPAVIATSLQRPHGKPSPLVPAVAARAFLVNVGTEIAIRRMLARDTAGAAKIVALIAGPLSAAVGKTKVGSGDGVEGNYGSRLIALRTVVDRLQGKTVVTTGGPEGEFVSDIWEYLLRPYRRTLTKPLHTGK